MTIEDRLRQAIEARARSVEPSPDALDRITDKLDIDREPPMKLPPSPQRWLLVAAAAAVVLVLGAIGVVVLPNDDPDTVGTVDDPDTTEDATPSTTEEPTTTIGPPLMPDPTSGQSGPVIDPGSGLSSDMMIWPRPSSSVRFDTAEAAARSYAVFYAGFDDPVIGTLQESGTVSVQAVAGGRATEVLVRKLGDWWFVESAAAADIVVTGPNPGASLVCPEQVVNGYALAFEGHVNVRIDAFAPDGARHVLGEGFVTGSGAPPAGPFNGSIPCRYPTAEVEGAVILTLWEESQADAPETTGTLQVVSIPLILPG